ncbi:MAG: hypothetical protein M3257_06035, partial [Actinomycetota bacterium]|nr:hypothetical protein [Actinomycetota bacterium]
PEKTLVTIGHHTTLNASSVIQCHSQEEGIFTSDHTTIGTGCTVGVNAFIHYGVTMGDGAVLDADSFLMKGEQITPHTRWHGNPAREIRAAHQIQPAREIRPAGERNVDPVRPRLATPAITALVAIAALKRRHPVPTCRCSRWRGTCGAA